MFSWGIALTSERSVGALVDLAGCLTLAQPRVCLALGDSLFTRAAEHRESIARRRCLVHAHDYLFGFCSLVKMFGTCCLHL